MANSHLRRRRVRVDETQQLNSPVELSLVGVVSVNWTYMLPF